MKHYKHFSEKERENLYFFLLEWRKQYEIAILLDRNPSSISREIKRNSIWKDKTRWHTIKTSKEKYHYLPNKAHKKYLERKSEVWKMWAILKWYYIRKKVIYYIKMWYSPRLISWIIEKEWPFSSFHRKSEAKAWLWIL